MRRLFAVPPAVMSNSLVVEPLDLALHVFGRQCGEMVIQMELCFGDQLEEHVLATALDILLDVEPVLGCRLDLSDSRPRWKPVPKSLRRPLTFSQRHEEYEAVRRTGLDATANVQIAACLLRRADGDHLLIKMSHEAGDGVALQYVVSRVSSIYTELLRDWSYRPKPNVDGRRDFDQILARIPKRAYARILWDFMRFMAPRWFPRTTHLLPLQRESSGPWVPVIKGVPAARLRFLKNYGKSREATINDMFLAAAYRALATTGAWNGSAALRISMTVDLRRWCLSRTHPPSVCNLSSFEHPFLIRDLGHDFDATLARVRAMTHTRKKSWPGLAPALIGDFCLRRGHARLGRLADRADRRKAHIGRSRTVWEAVAAVLSNEGRLDEASLRFGIESPVAAHILPPFLKMPDVHICLSGYNGALTIAAVTPENGVTGVDAFLDAFLDQLPAGELPALAMASGAARSAERRLA
jgi:NRPS condensation-like uncharacterized protein